MFLRHVSWGLIDVLSNTMPLIGYRISWEEFNRTNTRVTHYLPNLTQDYRVTGLTALTTYTIQVAGMTTKGQGQLSSSTISSGVPPGLPLFLHAYLMPPPPNPNPSSPPFPGPARWDLVYSRFNGLCK